MPRGDRLTLIRPTKELNMQLTLNARAVHRRIRPEMDCARKGALYLVPVTDTVGHAHPA
jgi:hypothetical protein